jgi:PHS family inorganic phosphate transporter-like MFS transporter
MATIERESNPADAETFSGGLEIAALDDGHRRLPFALNLAELKLIGIAGVGFFLDAYDLFIINQVASLLQFEINDGAAFKGQLIGVMKAGANIGAVIGQCCFGVIADRFGRKGIYGIELMINIFGMILTIAAPTGHLSRDGVLLWLTFFRIVQGVGIGGDYPLSASVVADRAPIYKRGALVGYIFANQGWGSLIGSIVTIVVLVIYKGAIDKHVSATNGVWRIIIGVALVPAFITLYFRVRLRESKNYIASKNLENSSALESDDALDKEKAGKTDDRHSGDTSPNEVAPPNAGKEHAQVLHQKASWQETLIYFGEWRHMKLLLGTTLSWFFLDIAFYGINLNTNVVLAAIGLAASGDTYEKLYKVAVGNLVITILGFVPGYYVCILTVEYIGRKPIQLMGFIMCTFFLGLLAGLFKELGHPGFIVLFTLLQFFFNFGANTTTFLFPVELFPPRHRATAHGFSAGSGKVGAVLTAIVFAIANTEIGTGKTLYILMAASLAGVFPTLLLVESKGYDADAKDREEIAEKRRRHHQV